MLDSRINQNFNRPIVSPQFRASQNVSKPAKAEEKQGMSTTAKWAIGLGLTALASYGIYAFTKGRVKGAKPTPKPENPIPEIKEMAVNAFKEAGNKFDKGKAILADGTKYTGNITSTGKDGSKVVMEYVDGVLQKSTKTAKDGTKVFEKTYKYENNLLHSIDCNEKRIFTKIIEGEYSRTVTNKGYFDIDLKNNRLNSVTIQGDGQKEYYYTNDNKLKVIKGSKGTIIYNDDGRTISTKIIGNKYEFYDKKGNLIDSANIDRNSIEYGDFYFNENEQSYSGFSKAKTKEFIIERDGYYGDYTHRISKLKDGKIRIRRNMFLKYKGKDYLVTQDTGKIKITLANSSVNIDANSDEYKEILLKAESLMRELKSKYRTALKLKDQAVKANEIVNSL